MQTVNKYYFNELLNLIVNCSGSTTYLLESISGKTLSCCVNYQRKAFFFNTLFYLRTVDLITENDGLPVLYGACILKCSELSVNEINNLESKVLPLGKILDPFNRKLITKKDIHILTRHSPIISSKLQTVDTNVICKKYRIFRKEKMIGTVSEYMNAESIYRAGIHFVSEKNGIYYA